MQRRDQGPPDHPPIERIASGFKPGATKAKRPQPPPKPRNCCLRFPLGVDMANQVEGEIEVPLLREMPKTGQFRKVDASAVEHSRLKRQGEPGVSPGCLPESFREGRRSSR